MAADVSVVYDFRGLFVSVLQMTKAEKERDKKDKAKAFQTAAEGKGKK